MRERRAEGRLAKPAEPQSERTPRDLRPVTRPDVCARALAAATASAVAVLDVRGPNATAPARPRLPLPPPATWAAIRQAFHVLPATERAGAMLQLLIEVAEREHQDGELGGSAA